MRVPQIIAIACLLLCAVAASHAAEKRVALVVGNGAYRHAGVPKLDNPINDAQGMRDALKTLGFDVIYGENLDLKGLGRAIGQFAGRVEDADVAIVYFAGHGSTFDGASYVVPVDAEFASLTEVPHELVSVERLIGDLRKTKGVRIAILDACRDDGAEQELKRRALRGGGDRTRGLVPMKNASGLIIAYATQYGETAADDGIGGNAGGPPGNRSATRHSPFTTALLNNIATPGLDVTEMFRNVGREVAAATGGTQRPEIAISMYDQYVLAPGGKSAVLPPRAAGRAPDEMAWNIVRDTGTAEQLRRFIAQFPASPRRREAQERIAKLERMIIAVPSSAATPSSASAPADPGTSSVPVHDYVQEWLDSDAAETAAWKDYDAGQAAEVWKDYDAHQAVVPGVGPCSGLVTISFPSRCAAPLTAAEERGLKPKDSFRECESCPEMVVVPAGSFTMGSPEGEQDRIFWEGPQHVVTISRPFAVGKLHVTVHQFAAFVHETGYEANSECYRHFTEEKGRITWRNDGSWLSPGFAQEGTHPVVCVSWNDANAYANWLAKKTGKQYRLLSEAEWEYAVRGSTSPAAYPRFWFGDDETDLCRYGNGPDQSGRNSRAVPSLSPVISCNDGYAYTSPAGHYPPNAFGLHDMFGNARQWTADCWHESYSGAPADGSAWKMSCGNPRDHTIRGGSWYSNPEFLRAAARMENLGAVSDIGFRIARTLAPCAGESQLLTWLRLESCR